MLFTRIAVIGTIAIFAGVAQPNTAQGIAVIGTGDPNTDIPAVQNAVDQGGRVVLMGHFSFDAPPGIIEAPSVVYGGTAMGTIRIWKSTELVGAKNPKGELPDVTAGTNPFYVDAPGAHVTIQGLHFIHPKVVAIRVVAAAGLRIVSNRIEGVARGLANAVAILIGTTPSPPNATDLKQTEDVSGALLIADNDIDMQGGADGIYLGVLILGIGKSPDQETDLDISANDLKNGTERQINIYAIGGRARIERNRIKTANFGVDVDPSGDVIHIVGPGQFLVAHNRIDCNWTSGAHAGIRLQSRTGELVSYAIVEDNDVNLATPDGTAFSATSAAIEVRGAGEGNGSE